MADRSPPFQTSFEEAADDRAVVLFESHQTLPFCWFPESRAEPGSPSDPGHEDPRARPPRAGRRRGSGAAVPAAAAAREQVPRYLSISSLASRRQAVKGEAGPRGPPDPNPRPGCRVTGPADAQRMARSTSARLPKRCSICRPCRRARADHPYLHHHREHGRAQVSHPDRRIPRVRRYAAQTTARDEVRMAPAAGSPNRNASWRRTFDGSADADQLFCSLCVTDTLVAY